MLSESFVLLSGIRARSEQKLWSQGVSSWDDFLSASKVCGFGKARKERFDDELKLAKRALRVQDENYFFTTLPFSDQWRLFNEFKDDAVYLDIETSGYYGDITVVGLSDGVDTKTMVRGFNLDKHLLVRELRKYKLLVTFNGASFDLPVLKRYFGINFTMPHMDLRFACQKAGYSGGLKAIERQLNIRRRKEVEEMVGEDAVYLWEMWKSTGKREYLNKLVWYNEEDILNLKPLAKIVIPELWKKTRYPKKVIFS